jgi:alkyl sulfatase BDS1-like metallo-beta-lactamase superfamily hydrolase
MSWFRQGMDLGYPSRTRAGYDPREDLELGDLDAAAFAWVVRGASEEALEELMTTDVRRGVLDGIFARLPGRLRRDAAHQVAAVVQWRIPGRWDGGEDVYEVAISNGTCVVAKTPARRPQTIIRINPTAFLRLVVGATDMMALVRTGEVTLEGDVELGLRVEGLFDRA